MKKFSYLLIFAVALLMTSCHFSRISVVPQAINTVATASFEELNMKRGDYIVMNTVSAEATIYAHYSDRSVEVEDPNGDFSLSWEVNDGITSISPKSVKGVLRLGYLSNDYDEQIMTIPPYPHWIVRRLAIYKLINAAKVAGADGIIEPVISTNVEQGRRNRDIVYKTTISGKFIKIKPDGK